MTAPLGVGARRGTAAVDTKREETCESGERESTQGQRGEYRRREVKETETGTQKTIFNKYSTGTLKLHRQISSERLHNFF